MDFRGFLWSFMRFEFLLTPKKPLFYKDLWGFREKHDVMKKGVGNADT